MRTFFTLLLLLACGSAFAQSVTAPLQPFHYLLGDWVAEGTSPSGSGYYSFKEDLDQHILLRRNHADVPANGQHAAISHDDLLVMYADNVHQDVRALFTDNEGHVIHYTVSATADGKTITFLSPVYGDAPVFKLIYAFEDDSHVNITFQVAKASAPNDFHTYISGKAHKK